MVRRGDLALSLGLLVAGQLEVWLGGAAGGSWPGSLTLAAAAGLLLARRRAPVATAFGVVGCQFVCSFWAEPAAVTSAVIGVVAWYSVGRWATARRGLIALATMLVLAVAMITPDGSVLDWINLYLAVALTTFAVPWLVGYVLRSRAAAARAVAETYTPSTGATTPHSAGADLSVLSPREREVFDLLAKGATNTEIAAELFLSVYTVKAHVASILAKLGLRDRVQVVVFAHAGGEGLAQARDGRGAGITAADAAASATTGSTMTRPPASAR